MRIPKFNLTDQLLLLIFLFGSISTVFAQKQLSGVVTDASSGEPLIGASIIADQNISVGTITDFDGTYTINVPEGTERLRFSYTGYGTIVEEINGRTDISVAMSFGEILEDIVVVGYGSIKKEDATGSIQSVSAEQFNRGSISSAQELLAGKVAGVSIIPDPSPGGGASILIRGLSSISASNDPLFIIDGVPIDGGGPSGARNPLNFVNPNDIESMTVLKDASATAIYGSRAAGGVILITTKKGKLGKKISLAYNGNISLGVKTKSIDVLTADEFRTVVDERFKENSNYETIKGYLGDANTDWQDEIYESAIGHDHNISASGGIGNFPYRVSLGYTDKNGILLTDNFNRLTGSVNLTPGFLNNTLQLQINFKGMLTNNHFADRGAINNALAFDPTKPVYDSESPYAGYTTWTNASSGLPNILAPRNPVALLNLRSDESTVQRYISTFNADYRMPFLPALRANLNLAYDLGNGEGSINVPTNAAFAFDQLNGGGTNNIYDSHNVNSLLETYLNYNETFGKHGFEIMGGYSWQHFLWESSYRNSNVAGTENLIVSDSNAEELYLLSLFGRLNYNFNERFFATINLRSDATSRFSPETRWGYFPGFSLAYKILDNENAFFDFLKVRIGYGVTGQQDIGGGGRLYAYQGIYQSGFENAAYQFGDEFFVTLRPNGYAEDIKWEEQGTTNIGLDFSVIKNKLDGSIDVYQRNTKDLLATVTVPAGSNLTNEITTNVGTMVTQGLEVALNYTPFNKPDTDLNWNISANLAYNQSEITKLTVSEDENYIGVLTGGIAGGVGSNIQIYSVGFTPNSYYVYKQLYAEDGSILEGQFEDLNGDGEITEADKYRYKDPFADYTFGITNNFSYKNFDLAFAGRASLGNYNYHNVETESGYYSRLLLSSGALVNINQSAIDNNIVDQSNITFSDHFVQDASFFRMDHITLGYNFHDVIGKFFRIYATVQNPFVITNYQGLDPEIAYGIDNSVYPRIRTFVFGVSLEF